MINQIIVVRLYSGVQWCTVVYSGVVSEDQWRGVRCATSAHHLSVSSSGPPANTRTNNKAMMGSPPSSIVGSGLIVRSTYYSLVRYWSVSEGSGWVSGGWCSRWQLGWGSVSSDVTLSFSWSVTLALLEPGGCVGGNVVILLTHSLAHCLSDRERARLTWIILSLHISVKYKY